MRRNKNGQKQDSSQVTPDDTLFQRVRAGMKAIDELRLTAPKYQEKLELLSKLKGQKKRKRRSKS
jgi:hypothetical protein